MWFFEILKIIFLGIVEGITEWLPISSTGHMILFDEFVKLNLSPEFKEMFFVVIQLGAILAVVLIYFKKLNPFFKPKKEKSQIFILWSKVIFSALPAGVIGIIFNDLIDELFYNYVTVSCMLIVYGILFIVVENFNKNKIYKINSLNELSYKTAFLIGIFQILALIPGTSRSGATIIGGMILGANRFVSAEFTFFLAIPVMLGASFLKLLKFGFNLSFIEIVSLIIGSFVSFIVSVFSIKFLMKYIKTNSFKIFGYYRIILGIILILFFLITK